MVVARHTSKNLEVPLVRHFLKRNPQGRTCVLTSTNEEALRVLGLLNRNNVHAKLIQSADGFRFYDLIEVRRFLYEVDSQLNSPIISDELWERAKAKMAAWHSGTANWGIVSAFIEKFESVYAKKYRSDLYDFVMESQLEDFCDDGQTQVFVSTIHKAKGREFDNVFMLLDGVSPRTDEERRRLYVGMTRAKKSLVIHCNNDVLDCLQLQDIQWFNDDRTYVSPDEVMMHLTHRDVYLDFVRNCQPVVFGLRAEQPLRLLADGLAAECGPNKALQPVVKYSRAFSERLEKLRTAGYEPHSANVRFVVMWRGEEHPDETAVVLPTLVLRKKA